MRGSKLSSMCLAAALLSAVLAGCGSGDGLDRQAVSGTVQLDGKPLAKGEIQFMPSAPSEVAIASGAPIANGSYSISKADGLVPGTYKVMISAAGAEPKKGRAEAIGDMPGLGPLNAEELVPAKYNAQTTLTAKVEAGGKNVFDFNLSK